MNRQHMTRERFHFAEHIRTDVATEGADIGVIGTDVPDEFPPNVKGSSAQVTVETPLRLVNCCNVPA